MKSLFEQEKIKVCKFPWKDKVKIVSKRKNDKKETLVIAYDTVLFVTVKLLIVAPFEVLDLYPCTNLKSSRLALIQVVISGNSSPSS